MSTATHREMIDGLEYVCYDDGTKVEQLNPSRTAIIISDAGTRDLTFKGDAPLDRSHIRSAPPKDQPYPVPAWAKGVRVELTA